MELRNKDGLTEKEFLAQYKQGDFECPSLTADILLFTIDTIQADNIKKNDKKELKVLLIKRNNHPYMNAWAVPGGFVNKDESALDAAYRELEEETSIKDDVYLEQLYTFSKPGRDPRCWVVSNPYMALTPSLNIKKTQSGDDASDAKWFTISKNLKEETETSKLWELILFNEDLNIEIIYDVNEVFTTKEVKTIVTLNKNSKERLAFDHYEMINMALDRIRNKIWYTNIAFHLLPDEFTLTEFQQVFEILSNINMPKSNFRKKTKDMVIKTDKTVEQVGYRPSSLYKQNLKFMR